MTTSLSPRWPDTVRTLEDEQTALGARREPPWHPSDGPPLVAGCFVCFGPAPEPGAPEPAWAAAALLRGRRVVATTVVAGRATEPYVPGLLALREGRLLSDAIGRLPGRPDVLMVNATGRDHPRRAGLALHLGAVLDTPSVGVTDRPLVAAGPAPAPERGAASPLLLEGAVVGFRLVTRAGARPVVVHAAHRTDAGTAVGVVRATVRRARTPEPLRRARRAARTARAEAAVRQGGGPAAGPPPHGVR